MHGVLVRHNILDRYLLKTRSFRLRIDDVANRVLETHVIRHIIFIVLSGLWGQNVHASKTQVLGIQALALWDFGILLDRLDCASSNGSGSDVGGSDDETLHQCRQIHPRKTGHNFHLHSHGSQQRQSTHRRPAMQHGTYYPA